MSISKILAPISVATCILVTATALGLHQPRGEGGVGGSSAPYSDWYGTNTHSCYGNENYPDTGQFQETSYSVMHNSEQQPVFSDFSDSSQPLQYHQHQQRQHQLPHGPPLPRISSKVKNIFSRAKERVQDMVDNAFQSNLSDQQDYYTNSPSHVAYYNSPVVYSGGNDAGRVSEQVGSSSYGVDGGVIEVAEQWYSEEKNQNTYSHQTTKPTAECCIQVGGGQGWYGNPEQQTLNMQQNSPISSPHPQQTCGDGGLEGTPASGWGEDMDNDLPLPSSSSLAHCRTRKRQGGGDKNDNIGKDDSFYDLNCLQCTDDNGQDQDGKNIFVCHSVDKERAAADGGGWIVNGRTIDGETRCISAKTEQQQSLPGSESSSTIGQGWDDADAAQSSEVPETLTGTLEQPPVEGILLKRKKSNSRLCGDNDGSERGLDFKEMASTPKIDDRAHQQNRGLGRSVQSVCINDEEELLSHPLKIDVNSRISWDMKNNLVAHPKSPPKGGRVLPNIEGGEGDVIHVDEIIEDDGYNPPKGGKKELLKKGNGDGGNGDIAETSSYVAARFLGEPSRDVLAEFEAELEVITKEVQKQIDEEENEEEYSLVQVQPESGEVGKYVLRNNFNIHSNEAEATELQDPIFKHRELPEDNPQSSTDQGKGMGSVKERGAVSASLIMPANGTTHASQIEGDGGTAYSKNSLQNTIEQLPPSVIKGDMWNDEDLQEQLDKYWEHVKSKPNDDVVTNTLIGNIEPQQQVTRFGEWRPVVPNNTPSSSSTNHGATTQHSYVGGQIGQSFPPINIFGDVHIHSNGQNPQYEQQLKGFHDGVNGENEVSPNHNSYWTGHH